MLLHTKGSSARPSHGCSLGVLYPRLNPSLSPDGLPVPSLHSVPTRTPSQARDKRSCATFHTFGAPFSRCKMPKKPQRATATLFTCRQRFLFPDAHIIAIFFFKASKQKPVLTWNIDSHLEMGMEINFTNNTNNNKHGECSRPRMKTIPFNPSANSPR